ncbi:MAG TPA: hypothetical protein EYP07_01215 [Kiloniellaceae bacterium]|nr:hypothetical protein [Kiloniellaceae bacterium]
MKLVYFDKIPNFGDTMNAELFPALLPSLPWSNAGCSDIGASHFVGIGSILDARLDHDGRTVVFGTGIRSTERLPNLKRGVWDIRFVRGPLSARAVNARFITDSAYAYALLHPPAPRERKRVSFVPHYATAMEDGPVWRSICDKLGIVYVDPRAPFHEVTETLLSSRLVISEAMHGAIFADLNRIPWIAFKARVAAREGPTNDLKWQDWTTSLDIDWAPRTLPVFWPARDLVDRLKRRVKIRLATRQLARLVKAEASLSGDRPYQSRMDELAEEVTTLQSQYGA